MSIFSRFHPENLTPDQCNYTQKILKRYILGIFICRSGGDVLYSFQIDPTIKVDLISQFIAALHMFGEENTGKIRRIFIEGLNIEMNIVTTHDLIFTAFFRPNMVKDYLKEESIHCLELFYDKFKEQLSNGKSNSSIYETFDNTM